MPAGFSAQGLPLSVQLSAAHFCEGMLLRVARAYDRATGWSACRAPLPSRMPEALPISDGRRFEPFSAGERTLARWLADRAGLCAPTERELFELAAANTRMTAHLARVPQAQPLTIEPDTARLNR